MMARLGQHDAVLEGGTPRGVRVRLRPMIEEDWGLLLKWNNDPEVLYYAEGDDVTSRTLEEVQGLYCQVCQDAFCFVIEADGVPIGECWLQEMNVERILTRYPGLDCQRIDLMIGEKDYWGQGIGTETIRLLTEFGFAQQGADMIFGCFVSDYNPRSRRAFQRVGYEIVGRIDYAPGKKARYDYDLGLTRDRFVEGHRDRGGRL